MDNSSVEDTYFPRNNYLKIKDKLIDLSVPKIMGIINLTPDSFYVNSRKNEEKELLTSVNQMLEDGADWIDLGGFSTRPNASFVTEEIEIDRINKPIELIRKEFPELVISLDTFRAKTAKIGIDLGIDIINDISGFQYDEELINVVAHSNVAYILMHALSNYELMHQIENHEEQFKNVILFLSQRLEILKENGVTDILIDPGFGFGKTVEQNFELLEKLEQFNILGHPLLVGFSRKSMLNKKLGIEAADALNATTIVNTRAILSGAKILRVHDVKEARQIVDLFY